jgi:3-phenylpropionate/cinnamic acid dioxygenase small subunit
VTGDAGMGDRAALAAGQDVLEREAVALDEQRWDDWLALFAEDCEYWLPTWRHDETLTENPRAELSHIYYVNRAGLEDRIVRIRSGRSPASMPLPRTTHLVGNIRLREAPQPDRLKLRSSWTAHVFFTRSRESHAFFGHSEHDLVRRGSTWLILRKKVVLQNDYIPGMIDIYCV